VRGGKPSKEADDDAAEAKLWRGRGGIRVNNKGFATISKGNPKDEGSDYNKN